MACPRIQPPTACIALLLAAFACADRGVAVEVFRCTGADGAIVYQDVPCNRDQQQATIQLADDPPPPAEPVIDDAPAPQAAVQPAPVVDAPPVAPTGPSFFLCTRYDGSRYISEDGVPGRTAVPFGMVAGSGRSLADAYGGRDGIGVSAPGLRTPPTLPADSHPLAGAHVWIDDECHYAQPREACNWLRAQLDDLEYKLKRAFSDTAPQLKTERETLRERMRGC